MATAKYPNLKPADGTTSGLPSTNVVRPEFDAARRRLSVSEKLAEGRGFWRGTFIGAAIGAAAGVAGSVAMMDVLVPPLQSAMQQGLIASFAVGAPTPGKTELTGHPTGGPQTP